MTYEQARSEAAAKGLAVCPFCGGAPERAKTLRGVENGSIEAFAYFVRCICCAATSGWAKSETSADGNWNMRVAPAYPLVKSSSEVDTELINWLEARKDRVRWAYKSWLYRGGDGPELVSAKTGEKWPEGITRATWREAAIDAMQKGDL